MADDRVETVRQEMIALACDAAKPYLNKESGCGVANGLEGDICGILWAYGFLKLDRSQFKTDISEQELTQHLDYFGALLNSDQSGPTVEIPAALAHQMSGELESEWQLEANAPEFLPEFLVKGISEFRVEMFHNEGKHPGRPHVKVTIKGVAVNISLDEDPEVLISHRNVRGLSGALKVIKKNREELLQLWDRTRPDDQRLNG